MAEDALMGISIASRWPEINELGVHGLKSYISGGESARKEPSKEND